MADEVRLGGGGGEEEEEGEGEGEENTPPLHGDILESIITHLPSLDLVPASYVSKSWRRAVSASVLTSSSRRHLAPWLILHLQSRQNPSKPTLTYGYEPYSHDWIPIPHSHSNSTNDGLVHHDSLLITSSHPGLLHTLSLTKLIFSTDALASAWTSIPAPRVWRTDAVVAAVGPYIIAAGGACDIEDEQSAVEVCMNVNAPIWETCEPMPYAFKDRAAATWLSVAVSDAKMYVMDRSAGWFCSFDPVTRKWELPVKRLQPDPAVYTSAIGFSEGRLIYVGVAGEGVLRMWEVDPEALRHEVIGEMPPEMVHGLGAIWSIGFLSGGGYGYVYNPSCPRTVIMCEIGRGWCRWESVGVPRGVIDQIPMLAVAFGCSALGLADLKKLSRPAIVSY